MAGESWMAVRAREELKLLEARHPERFDYLKLELQLLISDSERTPSIGDRINISFDAGTQASSNRKRRGVELRAGDLGFESEKKSKVERFSDARAELAIERAEECLRRIRLFKESFLR